MQKGTGFTLLELIIVIIVISILASIALPQYNIVVEKTRVVEAIAALQAFRGAQLRYFAQYGAYSTMFNCDNLDVFSSSTAYKYFYWQGCNAAGTGEVVITRNPNTEGGGIFGNYDLFITPEGNITCNPSGGHPESCSRLGFPPH